MINQLSSRIQIGNTLILVLPIILFKIIKYSYTYIIFEKIEQALKDVDEGRYQPLEDFCAEMKEKYDLK